MDISQQKEQFSLAIIHAVASVAGYATYSPKVDEDSVDVGIAARGTLGSRRSPRVEIQVKCTEAPDWRKDYMHYPLKLKNYIDLRGDDLCVPRILVIVVVPDIIDNWLMQSEHELVLRKCAYWVSLRTAANTGNISSVTVQVPKDQQFTVESLKIILENISEGDLP